MIKEKPSKLSRIIKYKAYTLKTLSIAEHDELDTWTIHVGNTSIEKHLPIIIDKPHVLLERKHYIKDLRNTKPRLILDADIDGLLLVDGEIYYGIDRYVDYIPLENLSGEHLFSIEAVNQRVLGEEYEKPIISNIRILYIYEDIESYANKVLWLLEFIDSINEQDLRRELLDVLEESISEIDIPTPSPTQLLLIKYRDYPSKYPILYDELLRLARNNPEKLRNAGFGSIDYDKLRSEVLEADKLLMEKLEKLMEKYPKRGIVYAVANSHIDVAWLWDPGITYFKVARNTAKILSMIKKYQGIVYVFSSALFLKWLEEKYPQLYHGVLEAIRNGNIVLATSTWVESDTMITPSETLIREFLYAQRYTLEKIGSKSWIYWLPDSFGYSANLPQILREAGIEFFVGYKTKWNQYNRVPYTTFIWKGIDGSTIPAHLLIGTYTHTGDPGSLHNMWEENCEKEYLDKAIYAYGYGDGGGGPTNEMIKKITFYGGKTPLLPYTKHNGLREFVEEIKALKDKLPVWSGELYVEAHRGTYTTNTLIKAKVWILDYLLRVLEQLYTMLFLQGWKIDMDKLRKYWEIQLIAVFHDILPGSGIHSVYEYMYDLMDDAIRQVLNDINYVLGEDEPILYNPTQWFRREVVEVDYSIDNPLQLSWKNKPLILVELEPYSWTSLSIITKSRSSYKPVIIHTNEDRVVLENKYLSIIIDKKNGLIKSIRSIHDDYEYLEHDSNQLTVHDDTPHEWDAWDIDEYSLRHYEILKPVETIIVEKGPLRATILNIYHYKNSVIKQYVSLTCCSPLIDFYIEADIHDRHILVKNWFKPRLNDPRAFSETPYGVVERTTHLNTSWEWARYEQPFLNWFTLEDDNHGFAVISPIKHGVTIMFNRIGLSLLRTPIIPDPLSDSGYIEFSYHILPYRGSWLEANVHVEAEKKSNPILVTSVIKDNSMISDHKGGSLIEVAPSNIVIEAIKPAEDLDGIVIRAFNYSNSYGKALFKTGFKIKKIYRVNIVEDEIQGEVVKRDEKSFIYEYRPYEIITLKIIPA